MHQKAPQQVPPVVEAEGLTFEVSHARYRHPHTGHRPSGSPYMLVAFHHTKHFNGQSTSLKAAGRSRDTCPDLPFLTSYASCAYPSPSPRSSVRGLSGGLLRIAVCNRVAGASPLLHSGVFLGDINETFMKKICFHCSVDAVLHVVSERRGLCLMRLRMRSLRRIHYQAKLIVT